MPLKRSKKSGDGMKVEKDVKDEKEFLIDGGKSAMMTMRRRPLADRSRLELRQVGNRKGTVDNSRQLDGRMVGLLADRYHYQEAVSS